MPLTYTNRKKKTYFLCEGVDKSGKSRYFFSREPQGIPLDAKPEGYVIQESINGVVSLVKQQPGHLSEQEIAVVTSALAAHPKKNHFRAEAKHKIITVYEPEAGEFQQSEIDQDHISSFLHHLALRRTPDESRLQFSPIMRFVLVDANLRYFRAERMRFTGMTRWIHVSGNKTIDKLAPELIATLGTDQFYELYRF